MSARVESVNVGQVREAAWVRGPGRTAIDKTPAPGPVRVHRLGLEGDEIGDPRHHGGEWQAVYAFAREDLDRWGRELGGALRGGVFGENLTTVGLDVNEAVLGEHWRVGTALLSPVEVRIPCATFQGRLDREGYDAHRWMKRFTAEGRPGPYLRVLEEGVVRAGDPITVEHRPAHGVSVATLFAALTSDPDRLPELLPVEELPESIRARARAWATR